MPIVSIEVPVRRTADSIVIKEAGVQVIVDSSGVFIRIRGVPAGPGSMEVKTKVIDASINKVALLIDEKTREVIRRKYVFVSEKHREPIEVEGLFLSDIVSRLRKLGLVDLDDMALALLALYVIEMEALDEYRGAIQKEPRL